jgi:hypothetical protein
MLTACPAAAGEGAKGQPVGRRCGRIGLVVELAQVLLQATDAANADMYNGPVHELLKVRALVQQRGARQTCILWLRLAACAVLALP